MKTGAPLWTATLGAQANSSPAIATATVYVSSYDLTIPPLPAPLVPVPVNGTFWAFAAAVTTNCSGTPKTCVPLWKAATPDGVESSPAVANGIVYTASFGGAISPGTVWAFNATATASCLGTPKTCPPLWTAATTGAIVFSSPAIENGILFIGSDDHNLYAVDATGTNHCAGTPKMCTPLWTGPTGDMVRSSPSPAGNNVYVGSEDRKLYAFGLP